MKASATKARSMTLRARLKGTWRTAPQIQPGHKKRASEGGPYKDEMAGESRSDGVNTLADGRGVGLEAERYT